MDSADIDYARSNWSEFFDEDEKIQRTIETMVIGPKGVGKHTLVHSMFSDETTKDGYDNRHGFDFVSKQAEDLDTIKKYKFWIKDIAEEPSYKDQIYDAYYKKVKSFIFVFNKDDENGLKKLEETIKKIAQLTKKNGFVGVLIANNREGKPEKISFREALAFKEKFNLKYFIDADLSTETCDEAIEMIEEAYGSF